MQLTKGPHTYVPYHEKICLVTRIDLTYTVLATKTSERLGISMYSK